MTLTAVEGTGLSFILIYSTALFKPQTIQRFIVYFKNIISSVAAEPGIPLYDIEIMSGEEKYHILYDLNDTESFYPE
ncbi:MAG: hypothetical protein GY940_23300, partial [bacterium]|nr:hypothetical protein [bacterium]